MNSSEIRKLFLGYFREKGHSIEKPAPLVPKNDPSLLFTGAGMNQFKELFLGRGEGPAKAATCQRCFRATDIENVGRTSRHLTFLEMLGNFSFGDYFKEEAAFFAWEFLTGKLGISPETMLVTVFEDDDEAFRVWNEKMGLSAGRIHRMGAEDNFWEMGRTGPCGPCSEIIIDRGPAYGCGSAGCGPACPCDRHMELWNLVFTQYNRAGDGKLEELSQKNIDTGMGLERAACIVQKTATVFDTDIMKPIVAKSAGMTENSAEASRRIIADHARSAVFLAADGVLPSNEGRGYVLRKLIRRILVKSAARGEGTSVFPELFACVSSLMKDFYPYLEARRPEILHVLGGEEKKFAGVLKKLPEAEEKMLELKKNGAGILPGADYFTFYDTWGLPRDIIREKAEETGLEPDEQGFEKELEQQRRRSRSSSKFRAAGPDALAASGTQTEFTGYGRTEDSSFVSLIIAGKEEKVSAQEGAECGLITEKSPFYPESGGQKGDAGEIRGPGWLFKVTGAVKSGEAAIHFGRVEKGTVGKGDACGLSVDRELRRDAAANHTATHLLQGALKRILGEHVRQSGSFAGPGNLRFDYTHPSRPTTGEISEIESLVNKIIRANLPVETRLMPLKKALEAGASSLPGEEYGDKVRVVLAGEFSMELCGGTHVRATGDIGVFIIKSESSISSGVRRIEALTGKTAYELISRERTLLRKTAEIMKSPARELPERASGLIKQNRDMEKRLEERKGQKVLRAIDDIIRKAEDVKGISVIAHEEAAPPEGGLEALADEIKQKLPSSVCVLAQAAGGKVRIAAAASKEAVSKGIDAGQIAKETASFLGGGGGGRPDFAKAGGKHPEKLAEALARIPSIVRKQASKAP